MGNIIVKVISQELKIYALACFYNEMMPFTNYTVTQTWKRVYFKVQKQPQLSFFVIKDDKEKDYR